MRYVIFLSLLVGVPAFAGEKAKSEVSETKKAKARDTAAERNLTDKEKQKIWNEYLARKHNKEALQEIRATGM